MNKKFRFLAILMMLLAAFVFTGCDGNAADALFDSGNGGDGPTPTTYTVSFAAGEGTGSMEPVTVEKGTSYTIPANGFTAPTIDGLPDGVASNKKIFTCWNDGSTDKKVGESITVNSNIMLAAQWTNPSFTVGVDSEGTAKKVYFAKGNLQATIDASGAPTAWKFAANQYDSLGEGGANKTIGSAAGDVDLFGWSTASTTYGISTSTANKAYSGEFVDWGTAIDNAGTWRTLSKDEWEYLLNSRDSASSLKKCGVTVCGKANCLILAPDNFTETIADSYDGSTWATAEAAGLVCVPAGGFRKEGSNVVSVWGGFYGSATPIDDNKVNFLYFYSGNARMSDNGRFLGRSVRLVCGE